ncbi:hypothetical protein DFH06DRAFT_1272795 [Mycena polygramma]|nr:hypothetical protein DFH06DRAFT_1272795 [Mycena polygramma]
MAMPYPAYRPSTAGTFNAYPPNGPFNPSSVSSFNSVAKNHDDARNISRTPSPTPSEAAALSEGLFSWKQLSNWRFWIRKEWTKYYIIVTVIMVVTALISIYHHQIVEALTPVTKWLHDLKYGYLVPIGILFVISFPPLFGHEIVAILCGLVWGLWIGFAIVCAGTFIGEVGNFYAFKWCCRARGEKMERTQIPYACLARCVRDGGFKIALIARFSAIPGHFTTAVFSTCGMNIFVFSIAAILSLPKQFVTVYLGVILESSDAGTTTTKSKIISDSVLAGTFLVTLLAMWYIFHQMALAKPKARGAKLAALGMPSGGGYPYGNAGLNDSDASVGSLGGPFDPRASLSDIPLTANSKATGTSAGSGGSAHPRYDYEQQQKQRQYAEWAAQRRQYDEAQRGRPQQQQQPQYAQYAQDQHQEWDAQGRAIGYSPGPAGPVMFAPQPTRANSNRAEIRPGAYEHEHAVGEAEVYAHQRAPGREGTSEEVGWETAGPGGVQMRERERQQQFASPPQQYASPPQQYASPAQQYASPPPQQQYASPKQQYASPPMAQHQQSLHAADPPTPTQAQYATQPPPSAASTTLAYMRSPFEDPDPSHSGHGVEPTGASYHTAYGSEGEDGSQETHVGAGPSPPPSYAADAKR